MSTRERPRRGVLPPAQENIEKIAKVVKDGNCYGAQQMYKSTSARYISAERYSEALDILHSGSCIQLEHGQIRASLVFSGVLDIFCAAKSCFLVLFLSVELQLCSNLKVVCRTCQFQTCLSEHKVNYFKLTCGSELALLFVETLVKGKYPYDEDTLDRVRKIYKKFPRIPVPQHLDLGDDDDMQKLSEALGAAKVRVECCSSFLKAAIKWSAEVGAHRNGSPELHDMLAEYIYSESPEADMARVSYHFVRGKHPRKFASTLVNFMGKCYPGEDDVAIARAILMYLSHGNLRDSNCLMDELKKQLKGKDLDFPKSDLIQLINFLLQTLQRDALPLFNMLRQTYKSSIDREPVFNELLDVIAEKFYEVPRRNPLMQGMFGDIFKMMGGDGM